MSIKRDGIYKRGFENGIYENLNLRYYYYYIEFFFNIVIFKERNSNFRFIFSRLVGF